MDGRAMRARQLQRLQAGRLHHKCIQCNNNRTIEGQAVPFYYSPLKVPLIRVSICLSSKSFSR